MIRFLRMRTSIGTTCSRISYLHFCYKKITQKPCAISDFFFWFIFKHSESQLQIIKSTYRYLLFRRKIEKINHDIVWIPPSKSNTEYIYKTK